jgi:hypothetical protein
VADAVRRVAGGFTAAAKVRRLPKRVLPGELARLAAATPARESALAWALSETEEPVFFDGQHLLVAGQRKCGRSTLCATAMAEIARVYAPGAQPAGAEPGRHAAATDRRAAQVWLVDPRRLLLNVLGPEYVHRFASTAATVKQRMVELAAVLAARQPEDDPSGSRVMRRRWEGPEIFVVIDDAQRLPAGFDSPLEPIAQFVESGADVGLHVIYTRLFGGFSSSVGADPVMRMLRQANAPLLVMDSDPDEGFIRGKWKGHAMPRGRGFLLNTTESGIYVQVADAQLPETDQH